MRGLIVIINGLVAGGGAWASRNAETWAGSMFIVAVAGGIILYGESIRRPQGDTNEVCWELDQDDLELGINTVYDDGHGGPVTLIITPQGDTDGYGRTTNRNRHQHRSDV